MTVPGRVVDGWLNRSWVQAVNSEVWKRVVNPGILTDDELVKQLRAGIIYNPAGAYYNTLAAAEFRLGNFSAAIKAAKKSMELTPKEMNLPAPHPVDLAILAMSHLHLGNVEKAKQFYQQMNQSLALDPFKENYECNSFAAEVFRRFGTPQQFVAAGKITEQAKEIDALTQQLDKAIKKFGDNNLETIKVRHKLALSSIDVGMVDNAISLAKSNFDVCLKSASPAEDSETFNSHFGLSPWILTRQGSIDAAIEQRKQIVDFYSTNLGTDAPMTLSSKLQCAHLLAAGNKEQRDEAIVLAGVIDDKLGLTQKANLKLNRVNWLLRNARNDEVISDGQALVKDSLSRQDAITSILAFDKVLDAAENSQQET